MLGVLIVVFGPNHVSGLSFGQRQIALISSLRAQAGRATLGVCCRHRLANGLADCVQRVIGVVFGPFCMAYDSSMMADESGRAAGREFRVIDHTPGCSGQVATFAQELCSRTIRL